MDGLVTVKWLKDNLLLRELVLLDCTVETLTGAQDEVSYETGRSMFEQGHIPGAGFADLTRDLADEESDLLFAMPSPDQLRNEMTKLGVHDGSLVVLYDRSFTAWAARVWWMLHWIGFDNAVILDGGQKAWVSEGYDLSDDPYVPDTGDLSLNMRVSAVATQSDITQSFSNSDHELVDTLAPEAFSGSTCAYDRPGHILGASNIFALDFFDKNGCFKSQDAIAKLSKGDPDKRKITYCGAGILASVNAFVMVQLGFRDVAVYMASLQEWASNPDNPMEVSQK